jgi:hypothetical protein
MGSLLMGVRKSVPRSLAGAVALLLVAAATAAAVRLQIGDFVLVADGSFSPAALPQHRDAPITLRGKARIANASHEIPPALKRLAIEYDRQASVQTAGLAVCPPSRLEESTVPIARRRCADAIVGRGVAHAIVKFPAGPPIPISSPLTIFNAPRTRGYPTVLIHAFTTIPAPVALVVPVVIETIHRGAFGYRTEIEVPEIAGGAGVLVSGSLQIGKRWTFKGRRHSFANARCEVGHLQLRGEFSFAGGDFVQGGLVKSCGVRR